MPSYQALSSDILIIKVVS